jgi:hypothetical protein
MEFETTKLELKHRVKSLVGKKVIHVEGRHAHYAMVEEVDCSEWGVVITCRPFEMPGIVSDLKQPFMLSAAWDVLGARGQRIFAYYVSWNLVTDEELVLQAVNEAVTAGSLRAGLRKAEGARKARRR